MRTFAAHLLVAVVSAGCQSTPVATDDALSGHESVVIDIPSDPFSLSIGRSAAAATGGLEVTLSTVLEDSRCPTDVVCVWEGRARILVRVEGAGPGAVALELTLPGTESTPSSGRVGEYVVVFHSLDPHPTSTAVIDPDDYEATLSVEQAP